MKADTLFYYRKTMPMSMEEREKRGCKYYNHTVGIAGFSKPQNKMTFLFQGNVDDLKKYLNSKRRIKRTEEYLKFFQGGVS